MLSTNKQHEKAMKALVDSPDAKKGRMVMDWNKVKKARIQSKIMEEIKKTLKN